MRHIVLIVAYEGTAYLGWQKTREGPSIEAALEHALGSILQEPVSLRASSRTDRGVHAEHQVVDFSTDRPIASFHRLILGINALLPHDIRCLEAFDAPYAGFHPTLDALSKTYRYSISLGTVQAPQLRRTHWHVHYPVNVDLLRGAAAQIIGTHDFGGFCNQRAHTPHDETTRTVLSVEVNRTGNALTIDVRADRFLYKMARTIVGTIMWVACEKLLPSSIPTTFDCRCRTRAGITAPAHGLSLIAVLYPAGPKACERSLRMKDGALAARREGEQVLHRSAGDHAIRPEFGGMQSPTSGTFAYQKNHGELSPN